MWGLGSGIAGLIIGLKVLQPTAVMGALLSTARIQAIGDPINTPVDIYSSDGANVVYMHLKKGSKSR
ncbi:MAG: hypothetical protein PWR01_1507 [Clostridiales bacterium]|nr:hypothetical protein [Clostridiales bacterium]